MGEAALTDTARRHALRAFALCWAVLTAELALIMAFPYSLLDWIVPVDGISVVPVAMVLAVAILGAVPLDRVGDRVVSDFRADDATGRLRNVAEGLAIAIGEPPERVLIREAAIPNVGGFPTSDGVVVMATTGAVDLLRRDELEALVAAQFAGMRDRWCRLATRAELGWTLGIVLGAAGVLLARPFTMFTAAAMVFAPRTIEATRDLCADVAAVAVTKHPIALANALRRLAPSAAVGNQQKLVSHWYLPVSPFLALPKRVKSTTSVGTETGPERTWTDVDEVRSELLLRADRAEALAAGTDPSQFTGREYRRRWSQLGTTLDPPVPLPPPRPPRSSDTEEHG